MPKCPDITYEWVGFSSLYVESYYHVTFSRKCPPSTYYQYFDKALNRIGLPIIKASWMLRVKHELEKAGYTVKITAKALTE